MLPHSNSPENQTFSPSLPIQAIDRLGKDLRALSKVIGHIAYLITDDERLGSDLVSFVEANGFHARWFRSASEYLCSKRQEVASCLLVSRRVSATSERDLQMLLANAGEPPIILLSDDSDIRSCVRAIREGVHDFLTLPPMTNRLLEAITTAFKKSQADLALRKAHEDLKARWRSLTSREAEVMRYVVGGFLNKQTAFELGITENTVQVHRGRVMRKMRADSFAALVRMSLKLADWGEATELHAVGAQTWESTSPFRGNLLAS